MRVNFDRIFNFGWTILKLSQHFKVHKSYPLSRRNFATSKFPLAHAAMSGVL